MDRYVHLCTLHFLIRPLWKGQQDGSCPHPESKHYATSPEGLSATAQPAAAGRNHWMDAHPDEEVARRLAPANSDSYVQQP